MICPVCSSKMQWCFDGRILLKYQISYFRCKECGLIKTEEPFWLSEAYNTPIADLDVGYVSRNLLNASRVERVLNQYDEADNTYLDYAAGYGLFVRLMRDRGFDFYGYDKYCPSIFASDFVIDISKANSNFAAITAFEVLEHLLDPVHEVAKLMSKSDVLFTSTEVLPSSRISSVQDWWYFLPETGQHVTFWTTEALTRLAAGFGCRHYSYNNEFHLISRRAFDNDPLRVLRKKNKLSRLWGNIARLSGAKAKRNIRPSLLQRDFEILRARRNRQSTYPHVEEWE